MPPTLRLVGPLCRLLDLRVGIGADAGRLIGPKLSSVEARRSRPRIEHRHGPGVVVHHPAPVARHELGLIASAVGSLDRHARAPGGLAGGAAEGLFAAD